MWDLQDLLLDHDTRREARLAYRREEDIDIKSHQDETLDDVQKNITTEQDKIDEEIKQAQDRFEKLQQEAAATFKNIEEMFRQRDELEMKCATLIDLHVKENEREMELLRECRYCEDERDRRVLKEGIVCFSQKSSHYAILNANRKNCLMLDRERDITMILLRTVLRQSRLAKTEKPALFSTNLYIHIFH